MASPAASPALPKRSGPVAQQLLQHSLHARARKAADRSRSAHCGCGRCEASAPASPMLCGQFAVRQNDACLRHADRMREMLPTRLSQQSLQIASSPSRTWRPRSASRIPAAAEHAGVRLAGSNLLWEKLPVKDKGSLPLLEARIERLAEAARPHLHFTTSFCFCNSALRGCVQAGRGSG